jgi:hypothetical protein
VEEEQEDGTTKVLHTEMRTTPEWRLAVTLSIVTALHL